jgi:hypothetical protein
MDYLSKPAFPSHVLMLQRKGIFGKEAVIYVSDAGKFDTELIRNELFHHRLHRLTQI